jgi:hypothetical protein
MKEIIQKIALLFNLRIRKNLIIQRLYLKNVFKSDYNKRVLLAYITDPFTTQMNMSHSNLLECYSAAEIFNKLGYSVDVADYKIGKKINFENYEIIYGMGKILENSFNFGKNYNPLRIFYATGCNPIYTNVATVLRVGEFYKKHGKFLLDSSRLNPDSQHAQILLSDAVIVLGNDVVFETYIRYDEERKNRYYKINLFFHDVHDININKKNFLKAKHHFLWFGSNALLHKGLDILIDIFSKRDDIFLHICGANNNEKGFFNHYISLLDKSKNIINHGFVKIESEEFRSIMNNCAFVVFPSVCEGGSPAVLNAIANGGLIPIITKMTGLDLRNYGWVLEQPELELFERTIDQVSKLDTNELIERAEKVRLHVRSLYTLKNYKKNLEQIIIDIISKNIS